jgi:non-ribosomal peptide synthetase component F
VCCQKTAIGFVDAVFEILAPLLNGCVLVIAPAGTRQDVGALARLIGRHGVTRLISVPGLARGLIEEGRDQLGSVRSWTLSGEELSVQLLQALQRALPECAFFNLYGSSEVAADASGYRAGELEGARVPIGRPLANTQLYVMSGCERCRSECWERSMWVEMEWRAGIGIERS